MTRGVPEWAKKSLWMARIPSPAVVYKSWVGSSWGFEALPSGRPLGMPSSSPADLPDKPSPVLPHFRFQGRSEQYLHITLRPIMAEVVVLRAETQSSCTEKCLISLVRW